MASYTSHNKLIFFNKKTLELSLDIRETYQKFINLLEGLKADYIDIIEEFKNWLTNLEPNNHIYDKKSILSFVLSDFLLQNANIVDVIEQIKEISEYTQRQYALYMENFSYEKFVKKLEDNNEKFVYKINDTITKVLPQFLALPLLATVPSVLKPRDNWIGYLAVIIYCIICFLGLSYQKTILDYLKNDIDTYENNGRIPQKLMDQWKNDKEKINKLIKKQKSIYYILILVVFLCFLYTFIRLIFI